MSSEQKLKALIVELHATVDEAPSVSPETREAILALEHRLDQLLTSDHHSESPTQLLHQLESQFETDHPRTSALVREMLATLNAMGI